MKLEEKLKTLVNQSNHENFIYDFLLLFGISQTTITRAKKGNLNLSKVENQLIIRKKVFFEVYNQGKSLFETKTADLLERIHTLTSDTKTYTHNPRFIIVTDFKQFLAVDTKTKETLDTPFPDLWKRTDFFLPWTGKEKYQPHLESLADVKAAEKMAKIYDEIYHNNKDFANEYNHDLNIFLTRLLFCFFAEDTGIFPEENLFTKSLFEHSKEDGSDLKIFFENLFEVLDKKDKSAYPQYLQKFPYVNGKLFREKTKIPKLTVKVRELVIDCGHNNNWKEINPDIFGSMFQAVKTAEVRSGLGQHYTSVPNIMKVINPLFMDDLRAEFEKHIDNPKKLKELQLRLSKIRIFDPACGSGNFLIIAFKQMKLLEMDIIKRIKQLEHATFQINLSIIELKQFYGIEIDDFACEIAKLSLWLAEHQINCRFKEEFGEANPTLPLKESGNIVCGNALRMDWEQVCPKYFVDHRFEKEFERNALLNTPLKLDLPKEQAEVYILGNPPFDGTASTGSQTKKDIKFVFSNQNYTNFDYVSCWFFKASLYIRDTNLSYAFVSTNSICQGIHPSRFWPILFNLKQKIFFAYNSFIWQNSAKNNAHVFCVIVGISSENFKKTSYLYKDNAILKTDNIDAYLSPSKTFIIKDLSKPIHQFKNAERVGFIDKSSDFIISKHEYEYIIKNNPNLKKFFRILIGAQELLQGTIRYSLYLCENTIDEAKSYEEINRILKKVQDTRHSASIEYRFCKKEIPINIPFIVIPRVSSSNRKYLPIGFLKGNYAFNDSVQIIQNGSLLNFSILISRIHMIWIKKFAGRLKNDFRYSSKLVYNTFPFPKISDQQKKRIELCVQDILRVREKYSERTMGELYDPDKMPEDLLKAHQSLDAVIESCYYKKPFENDEQRLKHLFRMYELMTNNASEEELKQLELGV